MSAIDLYRITKLTWRVSANSSSEDDLDPSFGLSDGRPWDHFSPLPTRLMLPSGTTHEWICFNPSRMRVLINCIQLLCLYRDLSRLTVDSARAEGRGAQWGSPGWRSLVLPFIHTSVMVTWNGTR